ncbi:PEP-CTERM sorting domain-containing protein [Aliiglaciecola sp.]|nr:PEP-CTERM sorting domain-containing protein [Aliiglaciecola sp.]
MKNKFLKGLVVSFALSVSGVANAGIIGYYTGGDTNADVNQSTIDMLDLTGYSYTDISDVANFDFDSLDVLFTARYDSPLLSQRASDLENWVSNGGVLLIDDASRLNGYFFNAFTPTRTSISSANVEVSNTASSTLVNGRFGSITNTTLDGGRSSLHGGISLNSLPAGATVHLTGTNTEQVAAFSFEFGLGDIYYSTIPGWCYLDFCDSIQPFTSNYQDIYLPNLMDFGMELSAENRGVEVPEPSTLAIFALSLMGLASRKFKKQA